MAEHTFKFGMGDTIAIARSAEVGTVVGLAVFEHSDPQALLRYTAADGRAVKGWFYETELTRDLPAGHEADADD